VSFTCPICGRESEERIRDDGRVVIHECASCGNLVGAYLKEYYDLLRNFFKRYRLDRFKPQPPDWARSSES